MTVHTDQIREKTSGAGIDFGLAVLKNIRIESVSSLPAAGNKGRLIFNLSDNKLYYDNGTEWVEF